MTQGTLALNTWGGRRLGAGRPKKLGAGVPHLRRPRHACCHPVHVTLRVLPRVPDLRELGRLRVIEGAFADGCERFGFRLVHYSVQPNHIHLIVEAEDRRALGRGMKGLEVRIARRLNRRLGTKGRVFADRYHARALATPREVHHALSYVLNNGARHAARNGQRVAPHVDACSSGRYFDGWKEPPRLVAHAHERLPVVPARTWLLREGWRRHGLIEAGGVTAYGARRGTSPRPTRTSPRRR